MKCRRVWHHYAIVGPKREHSCPRVILRATKWTWVVIIDSPCSTIRQNMIHFVLVRVVFGRYELFLLVYPENTTRRVLLSPFQIPQEIKLICIDKNYYMYCSYKLGQNCSIYIVYYSAGTFFLWHTWMKKGDSCVYFLNSLWFY